MPVGFEMSGITSMRKPETPLSSQKRISEKTSSRTFGFAQLRSGCLAAK